MMTKQRKGSRWGLLVAAGVLAVSSAQAQTSNEAPPAPATSAPPQPSVFATVNAAGANRMLQRFEDPEQRQQMRAARRQAIEAEQALVAQVMPLDAATSARFVELLIDLGMEADERRLRELRPTRPARFFGSPEEMAQARERERFSNDAETVRIAQDRTRHLQALRSFLGEQRFQRYVDYLATQFHRMQAARLNGQLPAADKLSVDQRERLIALLAEEYRERQERQEQQMQRASAEQFYQPRTGSGQPPDMSTQLLQSAEQQLIDAQLNNQALLARLPSVLNERQISVFAASEANTASEAARVRSMRKRAGRDPEVPVPLPEALPPVKRVPVAAPLALQLHIKVDDAPVVDTTVDVGSDGTASLELGGVIIEATAVLFEDGWQEIATRFYERNDTGGRRRLKPIRIPSGQFAGPNPLQLDAIMAGSRGYAIIANLTVARRDR